MPGSPSVQVLASMARNADAKKTLPLLWYQATLNRKPPYEGNNFAQGRPSTPTRREATRSTAPSPPPRP